MKKQFAVIGLGRFGASVAKTLGAMNQQVLAIDINEERVEELSPHVTYCVQADATDEASIRAIGIRNCDVALISIGDVEASTLISLVCKEMGIPMVMAKAKNDLHARVLNKIGVDKIVFPERDMGVRIAHSLSSSNILEFIDLSQDHSVVEFAAPVKWERKSLKDLNVRNKYNVNIVAIKRGKETNISPGSDEVVQAGDTLVIIGANEDIERLEAIR